MKYILGILLIVLMGSVGLLLLRKAYQQPVNISSTSFEQNQPSEITVPPLSLEKALDNQLDLLGKEKDKDIVTILVTGDVLTARTVNKLATQRNDFRWPWFVTAQELQNADITYINLETPLVRDCPLKDSGFVFCGDVRNTLGFSYAGVDIVNLANNHIANYGAAGIADTQTVLTEANVAFSGLHTPAVIERKGVKFAFLGFNEVGVQAGVLSAEPSVIRDQVATAKTMADLVIVQFHWGAEYQRQPTSNQVRLAHLAVEAGADLVVGNHPHWWQPSEVYQDKLIVYSHGNFIFDQMWSLQTRIGIVGKYHFYQGKLLDVEFMPTLIENYGQPRWLTGNDKTQVLSEFATESMILQESLTEL